MRGEKLTSIIIFLHSAFLPIHISSPHHPQTILHYTHHFLVVLFVTGRRCRRGTGRAAVTVRRRRTHLLDLLSRRWRRQILRAKSTHVSMSCQWERRLQSWRRRSYNLLRLLLGLSLLLGVLLLAQQLQRRRVQEMSQRRHARSGLVQRLRSCQPAPRERLRDGCGFRSLRHAVGRRRGGGRMV